MKRLTSLAAGGAATSLAILGCFCGDALRAETVKPEIAVVPNANILFTIDSQAMRESSIFTKLKEVRDVADEQGRPDPMKEYRSVVAEKLGLEEGDVGEIVMSADLSAMDFSAQGPPDTSAISAIAAIQVREPVQLSELETVLKKHAEDTGKPLVIEKSVYAGNKILYAQQTPSQQQPDAAGKDAPPPPPSPQLGFSVLNGGKLILFGTENGLAGALDRARQGSLQSKTKPMKRIRDRLPGGAQFVLAFVPTSSMLETMRKSANASKERAAQRQGSAPMMVPTLNALAGMKGAGLSVAMDEKMTVALQLLLSSSDDAATLKQTADSMFVSMLKMMTLRMSGGKGMPMTDTIDLKQAGAALSVSISAGPDDFEIIGKSMQKDTAENAPAKPADTEQAP